MSIRKRPGGYGSWSGYLFVTLLFVAATWTSVKFGYLAWAGLCAIGVIFFGIVSYTFRKWDQEYDEEMSGSRINTTSGKEDKHE